jgi:hypothetical protein
MFYVIRCSLRAVVSVVALTESEVVMLHQGK